MTNFTPILLSSCQTCFVEIVPPHHIIQSLPLRQVPLSLQGAEMKNNYSIRSHLNLQETNFEHMSYFYRLGESDPSRSLVTQ